MAIGSEYCRDERVVVSTAVRSSVHAELERGRELCALDQNKSHG